MVVDVIELPDHEQHQVGDQRANYTLIVANCPMNGVPSTMEQSFEDNSVCVYVDETKDTWTGLMVVERITDHCCDGYRYVRWRIVENDTAI